MYLSAFWKEDRYLLYVDKTIPLVIHCIPQNSKVKLAKEIVQCMNKDGIKKLRRSSGTDDVQEEEIKLEADIVDSLDEIMDIITAVIGFGKFRDNKKRASTEVDAEFRSSKHGTSIHVHERFLNQIEPLSKELRRTYSERVEEFSSIRGRLTNRGMLRLGHTHRIGLNASLTTSSSRPQSIVLSRHVLESLHLRTIRANSPFSKSNLIKIERKPCVSCLRSVRFNHTTASMRFEPFRSSSAILRENFEIFMQSAAS